MSTIGTAYVDIDGRFDPLRRSAGGAFRSIAATGAALFASVGVTRVIGQSIAEAREAERVGRRTANVIESTGGVANVSADRVERLAERLSNLAGVDDEIIQGSENLLLTYSAVRNEMGAGNAIFDRATTAALDMSSALGTSMQSAVMQLGRSLQEPEKGLARLSRAGVSFSDAQRDAVEQMVASGDTLGAQKIILEEVERQFGGAAAAMADPAQKAGVAWANFQEKIGLLVLPTVGRLADLFTGTIIPTVEKVGRAFGALFSGDSDRFAGILDRLVGGGGRFRQIFQTVGDVIVRVKDAVAGFVGSEAGRFALIVTGIAAAVGLLTVALGALVGAISWPLVAVAALVAGLAFAYKRFEGFRNVVDTVARAVVTAFQWLVETAWPAVQRFFGRVAAWARQVWPDVQNIITRVVAIVGAVISRFVSVAQSLWDRFGSSIVATIRTAWDWIQEYINAAIDVITGVIRLFSSVLSGDWGRAWDALKGILRGVWDAIFALLRAVVRQAITVVKAIGPALWAVIRAAFTRVVGIIRGAVSAWLGFLRSLPGRVASIAATVFTSLINAAQQLPGRVMGFLSTLPGLIRGMVGTMLAAGRAVGGAIIDGISAGLRGAVSFAGDIASAVGNAIRGAINGLIGLLNGAIPNSLGWGPASIDIPDNPIPTLHEGGVFSSGSGEGLALLRDGEGVFTPEQMRALGVAGGSRNVFVVVDSVDEALEYVENGARPAARAFLAGRS